MKYFIQTFGCAANEADSERVAAMLESRGMKKAASVESADHVVVNTCMVRQSAEDRAYGLIQKLEKDKEKGKKLKIVVTGCMVGAAVREKSGKMFKGLRNRFPAVDEWLPIGEVGFDFAPLHSNKVRALVPISNGCNNYCTFCIVPFTRGREVSRPFEEIVSECQHLVGLGFREITLVGQNVNSYGADLLAGAENIQTLRDLDKPYPSSPSTPKNPPSDVITSNHGRGLKYTYVKHLGRFRLPTLFPQLLETVAMIPGLEKLDFISSNPWDFTDRLITVISKHQNISRQIHLPVQSGSDKILKKMNRWYTAAEYLQLVRNLKFKIKNLKLSTDIIVGFPGETKEDFQDTVALARKVGFYKAYIAMYSPRPMTAAVMSFADDIGYKEKKHRWQILENLINKPRLGPKASYA